jgi:hypothetical protein
LRHVGNRLLYLNVAEEAARGGFLRVEILCRGWRAAECANARKALSLTTQTEIMALRKSRQAASRLKP